MKIRISYTVNTTQEVFDLLVRYARHLGIDHDSPDEKTLVRRLYERRGQYACDDACEWEQFEDRKEDQP